jgi:hypothetical protein
VPQRSALEGRVGQQVLVQQQHAYVADEPAAGAGVLSAANQA